MPQPSKKKRDRLHSPQPRSEPAARAQPAGPPPDAPEEVNLSEQNFEKNRVARMDGAGLTDANKVVAAF